MSITKSEVLKLREELNKVLEKFNQTSDIKMVLQNAKYGTDVKFVLAGFKIDKDGNKQTTASESFKRFSSSHKIKESALNYPFKHDGKEYKILGFNSKNRKYSIEYSINGEQYKCTPDYIQGIIKQSAPDLLFT